jgi:hypothetical protein
MSELDRQQVESILSCSNDYKLIVYSTFGGSPPELNEEAEKHRKMMYNEDTELSVYLTVCDIGRHRACKCSAQCFGFALVARGFEDYVWRDNYNGWVTVGLKESQWMVDQVRETVNREGLSRKLSLRRLIRE